LQANVQQIPSMKKLPNIFQHFESQTFHSKAALVMKNHTQQLLEVHS